MNTKNRVCPKLKRIFIVLLLLSLIYTTQNINALFAASSSDDYWGLHKHRFYGFGAPKPFPTPQELSEMGVNLLNQMPGSSTIRNRLHAGEELSGPKYDKLLKNIKKHKDLGINLHIGISGLVPIRFDKGTEIPDEMSQHFVIDASGNLYPDKTSYGRREFWICLNHDYWISYISDIMVASANAGIASIHMDTAKACVCYCSICKNKWSAYIKNKTGQDISIDEANQKDGSPKITTYYAMYRYQCVIDFLRKAIREVKKINPNYGIETTNHMKDRSYYFWINGRDVFDIACLEIDTYFVDNFPPLAEALTSYRLCLAAMGKGKTAWT